MATSNSSIIGVNLAGTSDGATALFAVGSRVLGSNDTEWVYVNAAVSLSAGHMVYVNSTFTAQLANVTNAITGAELAWAQGAFNALDFGWVAKRGNPISVLISGVSTLGGILFISDSNSGILSAAGAASGTLAGIAVVSNVAATATAIVANAYVGWPRMQTFTGTGKG